MNPKSHLSLACLCTLFLLLGICGCASLGSGSAPEKIKLRMAPEGALFLGEKPVQLQKLPKTLKAQGATRATAVYIEVPAGVSAESIRAIRETLVGGGYSRMIFTKPRQASATTH